MKKIIYGFIILVFFVGCGDSGNKTGSSEGSQGVGAEIASLKEASRILVETYLKDIFEKKELAIESTHHLSQLFSALEEYDQCLGSRERKKSAQSCYDALTTSTTAPLKNLKAFIHTINEMAGKKSDLSQDKPLLTIAALLMQLILGKYFKLEDKVEYSHHVFSFPPIPSFSYSWAYSNGMFQKEDLNSGMTYNEAIPYFERAIGLKLFLLSSKKISEEGMQRPLQEVFNILNTNQLKINYSAQEIKSIWITQEIQEDDLKYASLLYAFNTWERLLGKPLFELKGVLKGEFDLKKPDGKNVILLKSKFPDEKEVYWVKHKTLGYTAKSKELEEADIGFLRETMDMHYCYEESIYDFLPKGSKFVTDAESFRKSLCMSSEDEKRYNFVLLVLHELAHYLGYHDHVSDKKHLMYSTQSSGLYPYSFEGVVEKILENQVNSFLVSN